MGRKTKINSIVTGALLAQIHPDNKQLVKDFLDYLKSINRSQGTIDGYQNDLNIAFVWNLENNRNKPFVEWTKRNVVAYQNWLLSNNENSPARIRRLKASLSSLSNFIENVLDDEYPDFRNIINKVESPALEPVREKTVLAEEEIEFMLRQLLSRSKYEMACYIALAAYGGRRKSEILRFKVSDFDDNKLVCGGSLYKSDPIKTKGRGNGKFLNCYTLAKKFKPFLDYWMRDRMRRGIESEWLFPDPFDMTQTLSVSTVDSWMNQASKLLGRTVYAHAFRHFYTTMLSNQGLPDTVIKEILGWADVGMVSVYNDRTTEDTLDMYFDEGGFKNVEKKSLGDL